MRMSPIEDEAAKVLTAEVKSLVHKEYPNNYLNPVGSYSTGLADRLSDFDFSLSFPDLEKSPLERGPSPTRPRNRKAGLKALAKIKMAFQRSKHFQDIEFIHARVPIIKAVHCETQLGVDIQTLSSHKAAREYTLFYLAEFPTLQPLYIVFRSALHLRQLNVVHEGGLGSYSILMMIVNALKHASGKYAQDDLVGHFLHVLDFYSSADLYTDGFSPDPPRIFQKKESKRSANEKIARLLDPMLRGIDIMPKLDPKKPYLLCLQDPANPINDLGCKAYGIKHIQRLFGVIRKGLSINMKAWEGDGLFAEPSHAQGLLAHLLAADYSNLEKKRSAIESWVLGSDATLRNASHIINGQNRLQGFRRIDVPHTEQQDSLDLSQHDKVVQDEHSVHAVNASATGELRVSMGDPLRSRETASTTRHPSELNVQSDTSSSPEPAIGVDSAVDYNEASERVEPLPAAGPLEATGFAFVRRTEDLFAQQPPERLKQQDDKSRLWKRGSNAWKKWAPPSELSPWNQQDLKAEADQSMKGSSIAPISNQRAEAINRKNLHVNSRLSQNPPLRDINIPKMHRHTSLGMSGQPATGPKSLKHMSEGDSSRSRKIREAHLNFQQRLSIEQDRIMEKFRTAQTNDENREETGKANAGSRPSSSLGIFDMKVNAEDRPERVHKIREESKRFYQALHSLSSDPEGRMSLLRWVSFTDRRLGPDEFLKLERREIGRDERLQHPHDRYRLVKWKSSVGENELRKINGIKSPSIRSTPSMATNLQERRLSMNLEQPDSVQKRGEIRTLNDMGLSSIRSTPLPATELAERIQRIYAARRNNIKHCQEHPLSRHVAQPPPIPHLTMEAVETMRREIDSLARPLLGAQGECTISPKKTHINDTSPLVIRKERVVASRRPGQERKRLRPSYVETASPFTITRKPSEHLFRVHGTDKGIMTPSRLGLKKHALSWDLPSDHLQDSEPDVTNKPHPLHWMRRKLVENMGKELGWKKFNDEAMAGPTPVIDSASEAQKQSTEPEPQIPAQPRFKISKYDSLSKTQRKSGPPTRFIPVRAKLDTPDPALAPAVSDSAGQTDDEWVQSLKPSPPKPLPPPSPELAKQARSPEPAQRRSSNERTKVKLPRLRGKGKIYAQKKLNRKERATAKEKRQEPYRQKSEQRKARKIRERQMSAKEAKGKVNTGEKGGSVK